jgi:hypothetical protein
MNLNDQYVIDSESEILLSTLARTQQECTKLLLENRELRDEINKLGDLLVKILGVAGKANDMCARLMEEKEKNWGAK